MTDQQLWSYTARLEFVVMDMRWDYQYYQLWSNNKWVLQKLIDDNLVIEDEKENNKKSYL